MYDLKYGLIEVEKENNFAEDEPGFIMRGRDPLTAPIMKAYLREYLLESEGAPTLAKVDFVESLEKAIANIEEWQSKNQTKFPD